LIQYCRTKTTDEIMEIPDVKERVELYVENQEPFIDMLKRCCSTDENVIITNLLDEDPIYAGNRFVVYALFPEQNIEVRIMWGKNRQNVVFTAGHSIINRTSQTNVGKLMLEYGGGGHDSVGTCQVSILDWEQDLQAIVDRMKQDG
jgi:nanoRNase/pAp phosphatase (c-di-AMP/oligoRNAs hydrolase)